MSGPTCTPPGTPPRPSGPTGTTTTRFDGELLGTAKSMTDVILLAAVAGIAIHDLDDPDAVRWVGGGKFTWKLH
ncbi:hypothetical protein ACFCXH_01785 [Streptomyces nojiriensis]|uniref:hypothetical protein n=1 Tax=Streptomyces nojiriensis TaxID=66374 RepID=UPI0035DB3525